MKPLNEILGESDKYTDRIAAKKKFDSANKLMSQAYGKLPDSIPTDSAGKIAALANLNAFKKAIAQFESVLKSVS